jgi:hypothetical protein
VPARWKLTVRSGPKVERRTYDDLDEALRRLEQRATELAADAPRRSFDTKMRRFAPAEQVVARLELSGPERLVPSVRGGVDVRGDGSVQAYEGRTRRRLVHPRKGESPYAALRRTVAE